MSDNPQLGRAETTPYRWSGPGWWVFTAGAAVGVLGGLIGLGGAEFRLPLLIGIFGFAALQAVILNKAMSLIVVITALPARLIGVPWSDVSPHWPVAVNLLAGSLFGAWVRGPPRCGRRPYSASSLCCWC